MDDLNTIAKFFDYPCVRKRITVVFQIQSIKMYNVGIIAKIRNFNSMTMNLKMQSIGSQLMVY